MLALIVCRLWMIVNLRNDYEYSFWFRGIYPAELLLTVFLFSLAGVLAKRKMRKIDTLWVSLGGNMHHWSSYAGKMKIIDVYS